MFRTHNTNRTYLKQIVKTNKTEAEEQKYPENCIGQIIEVDILHKGIETICGYEILQW